MRFELIDAVLERTDDRIVAVKLVSAAEEYLQDHFPDFPVLPGVFMLEAMVQAARLLEATDGGPRLAIGGVRALKYGRFVRPGETLRVEVERTAHDGENRTFKGVARVHGPGASADDSQIAATGQFVLRPLLARVCPPSSVR